METFSENISETIASIVLKAKGVILAEFLVVLYADQVRFHPSHPYNL